MWAGTMFTVHATSYTRCIMLNRQISLVFWGGDNICVYTELDYNYYRQGWTQL